MLFNSLEFLKYFALVYAAYWLLPVVASGRRLPRAGAVLLVAALAYAYGSADRLWLACCGDPAVAGRVPRPLSDLSASANGLAAALPTLPADLAAVGVTGLPGVLVSFTLKESAAITVPWRDWVSLFAVLAAVGALTAGTPQRLQRVRVWLLLGVSFCFYAAWNAQLAALVAITTLADFVLARWMDADKSEWRRRALLVGSLVMNLGLLCYFKYMNFFLDSLNHALRSAGGAGSLPLLNVLLPIGISFYTFEAINYTVDVYRRKVPAERDLANFMTFILFFPHLVAGPIVRAKDFLPQLLQPKRFSWLRTELGVRLFLLGLFKKLAIADRMSLFADPVFADPGAFNTEACWMAVIAYALQIYCDFSGYSDMALGTAHMLGYKLALNFNMPYIAANVSEFWRRWHISLSSWFRDYLFIPLGGSRGTAWQTDRNLLLTFVASGLWHGASWTFVVWGLAHGLMLVAHRRFREFAKVRPTLDGVLQSWPGTAARMALTLLVVMLAWVFFRAQTFAAAGSLFAQLFTLHGGQGVPLSPRSLYYTVAVVALAHAVAATGGWKWLSVRLPAPALGFGYAVVLTLALVLCPDTGKQFIYFTF